MQANQAAHLAERCHAMYMIEDLDLFCVCAESDCPLWQFQAQLLLWMQMLVPFAIRGVSFNGFKTIKALPFLRKFSAGVLGGV
eukprot:1330038-Pleurochrysis_carterae.AAC.1